MADRNAADTPPEYTPDELVPMQYQGTAALEFVARYRARGADPADLDCDTWEDVLQAIHDRRQPAAGEYVAWVLLVRGHE